MSDSSTKSESSTIFDVPDHQGFKVIEFDSFLQ